MHVLLSLSLSFFLSFFYLLFFCLTTPFCYFIIFFSCLFSFSYIVPSHVCLDLIQLLFLVLHLFLVFPRLIYVLLVILLLIRASSLGDVWLWRRRCGPQLHNELDCEVVSAWRNEPPPLSCLCGPFKDIKEGEGFTRQEHVESLIHSSLPSVHPSVHPSIRPFVRSSVHPSS